MKDKKLSKDSKFAKDAFTPEFLKDLNKKIKSGKIKVKKDKKKKDE